MRRDDSYYLKHAKKIGLNHNPIRKKPLWRTPTYTPSIDEALDSALNQNIKLEDIANDETESNETGNRAYKIKDMYDTLNSSRDNALVPIYSRSKPNLQELGMAMEEIYESQQEFDRLEKYSNSKAYASWVDASDVVKEWLGKPTLQTDIVEHLKEMQYKVKDVNKILLSITQNCDGGLANITHTLYANIDDQAKVLAKMQGLNTEVPEMIENIKTKETEIEEINKYENSSDYAIKQKELNLSKVKLREATHKDRIVNIGENHYVTHIERLENHQNIFQNISHQSKEIAFNIALYQRQLDDIIPIFEDTRNLAQAVSIVEEGVVILKEYNHNAMSAYASSVRDIMNTASEDPYMIESDKVLKELVGDVNSQAYARAMKFEK